MTTRTIRFQAGPEFKRAEDDNGGWFIEGFASTDAVDSYNEIVKPEAFRPFLEKFKQFPVVLLNHAWFDKPIGKVVEAKITERGLWVRVEISKTAAAVWQLIQEDILKAFSIGFQPVTLEEHFEDDEPDVWIEIELVELSIVNVPANREALFSVAESKGIDLSAFSQKSTQRQPITKTKKEGEIMDPVTLDQMKKEVAGMVQGLVPTLEATGKSAAEDAVKALGTKIELRHTEGLASLKEIQDRVKSCVTETEAKAFAETVKDEVSAILAENERLKATGLANTALGPVYDTRAETMSYIEKGMMSEFMIPEGQARALANLPEHVLRDNDPRRDQMRAFHEASDNLYIMHTLARTMNHGSYNGPRSLKYWATYSRIQAEFRKAMDTATSAEGTEWIPTNFSASLIEMVQLLGNVANLFDSFSMPTKVYEWPIQTGYAVAYLIAESLADASSSITASTPATSKTTFTAQKLAARVLTSTEFIEDSIIPALPFIRKAIAEQFVRAVEDAILNGDTAATHEDSDVTLATDHRKAWLGLRAYAHDNSYTTDTGTFALADLRTIRGTLVRYGVNPANIAYIMAPTIYITKFLADSDITTMEKAGARATWLTGEKESIDGAPLRVSEFVRENLNASGVYDGVTETKSAIYWVHRPSWMIGDRRIATIDAEKILDTDQFKLVGTMRKDFEAMHGTDSVASLGYNVS